MGNMSSRKPANILKSSLYAKMILLSLKHVLFWIGIFFLPLLFLPEILLKTKADLESFDQTLGLSFYGCCIFLFVFLSHRAMVKSLNSERKDSELIEPGMDCMPIIGIVIAGIMIKIAGINNSTQLENQNSTAFRFLMLAFISYFTTSILLYIFPKEKKRLRKLDEQERISEEYLKNKEKQDETEEGLMNIDNVNSTPGRPKFVLGYEIMEVVECTKCHNKMYIPKGWVDTPRSGAQNGPARDGNKCLACKNYICETCRPELHSGQFKCCPNVSGGVSAICYFSFSDATVSQYSDREQAKKNQTPIYVEHDERKEKRKEWIDKAKELKEQGQYERAFEYLDLIIRANLDTNGYVRHLKGSALIELERYEEAAECLKEAIKADPSSDYQFDLGRVLFELGHLEGARSNFEKVARGSLIYGLDKKAKEWLQKIETKI